MIGGNIEHFIHCILWWYFCGLQSDENNWFLYRTVVHIRQLLKKGNIFSLRSNLISIFFSLLTMLNFAIFNSFTSLQVKTSTASNQLTNCASFNPFIWFLIQIWTFWQGKRTMIYQKCNFRSFQTRKRKNITIFFKLNKNTMQRFLSKMHSDITNNTPNPIWLMKRYSSMSIL